MGFCWSDVDFGLRLLAQGKRNVIVPERFLDVLVIPPSSRSEVLSSAFMVGIDAREAPRCLLVPRTPALFYGSGLSVHGGAAAQLIIRVAQVKFAVITAFQLLNCVFHVVKEKFCWDAYLMMHEAISMYLLPTFVVEIKSLDCESLFGALSATLFRL